MGSISYKQKSKQIARHAMIRSAVELLTQERDSLCCVPRNYVRDLFDYFIEFEESNEQKEVMNMDISYIRMWEKIHSQYIGNKKVEDLTVCYLAGPEPENDFKELISMGVLPHNIWAFESEKSTYFQALNSIDSTSFFQPKLIKTSIEKFFENTPKEFDIVYIDACSPLISDQHALRCISTMFKYHRLVSPGILISNFAEVDPSNKELLEEYYDMIGKYNVVRDYPGSALVEKDGVIKFKEYYNEKLDSVKKDFSRYYGDFITAMICNAGSITVPALRFANSTYLTNFSDTKPERNKIYQFSDINTIKNNTFLKFLSINYFLEQRGMLDVGIKRIQKLENELSANWNGYTLLQSFQKLYEIKEQGINVRKSLKENLEFFEIPDNIYQFLDKPTSKLFLDSVINQLACPMHYCTDKVKRLSYVAKETRMYMDLIPFDECRYIYDWLPAIDQMKNAFTNKSWQYVFRFALDGLVKKRINYNNEFFFQGTVISQKIKKFETARFMKRHEIKEGEDIWH